MSDASRKDFLIFSIEAIRDGIANPGIKPGWAMGPFYPRTDLRFSQEFEIKEWNHNEIQPEWNNHLKIGSEYISVTRGKLIVILGRVSKDGSIEEYDRVEVMAGHCIILQPGLWRKFEGTLEVIGTSIRKPIV